MQSLRAANLRAKLNLRFLQTATSATYSNNNTATAHSDASSSEKNDDDTQQTASTLTDDTFTKEFMARRIQISDLQRAILAIGSSLSSIMDPKRHDMIAALGETTGVETLKKLYVGMYNSEESRRILINKPRINTKTVDFDQLKKMPQNTLGFQYHKFLTDNNVTPDSRLDVRFMDDPMLAYVMTRYRETHDLIHTVLDMPTNMLGEIAVKWIEAINVGLPMCYGGAIFGPMRLKPKHRELYRRYYLPWAIETGRSAKPLLNVYWEERWNQDADELRAELNIKKLSIPPKV